MIWTIMRNAHDSSITIENRHFDRKLSYTCLPAGRFDEHVIQLSGGTIDMGVIEIVKKQERQLGLQKGLQQGRLEERAKAEAEKRAIALEFKKMGIPVADIAKGTGLTIEEIEKLK